MGNHRLRLPSGAFCVRVEVLGERRYAMGPGGVALTVADVEALFADSIAGDGGRELPERCLARHCHDCDVRCLLEKGHHRPHEYDGIAWENRT